MTRIQGRILFILFISYNLISCGGPGYDSQNLRANNLLIKSSLDQANLSLSRGQCSEAYQSIYPIYESINSNNDIRLMMGSVYGCYAGFKLINFINKIKDFSSSLNGGGFFEFLVALFPSVSNPDDKIPMYTQLGLDAVTSSIKPGILNLSSSLINPNSYNPQTMIYTDRIDDANILMIFLSMNLMGALQSRYGLPDSSYRKTTAVPWSDPTLTQEAGCSYASAVLNLIDGLKVFISLLADSSSSNYSIIYDFLSFGVNQGCALGCSLCGGGVSCTECPLSLRNRNSCTGAVNDVNSCAAAGIGAFVNASWQNAI